MLAVTEWPKIVPEAVGTTDTELLVSRATNRSPAELTMMLEGKSPAVFSTYVGDDRRIIGTDRVTEDTARSGRHDGHSVAYVVGDEQVPR